MQVSRNAVVAAAVAFLALFGAVFFLLGRDSVRRRGAAAVPVEPPVAEAAPVAMPVAPVAMPASAAPPMPTTAAIVAAAEAPPPPRLRARVEDAAPVVALPEIRTSAPAPTADAAARDYFAQMQAIQTVGAGNDPNELANKLLTASMTGDTTGFDDLIKVAQAGAERARAIRPPPCCVAYHERLLGMLSESVTMVQQIKRAMASNDPSQLAALAASGSSLQTRATALEDEARRIKSSLGLAR